MQLIDSTLTQNSGTHHRVIAAHTAIVAVAIFLPRRLTAPCSRQLRIEGPKRG